MNKNERAVSAQELRTAAQQYSALVENGLHESKEGLRLLGILTSATPEPLEPDEMCDVSWCQSPSRALGMCASHYHKLRRLPGISKGQFLAFLDEHEGCDGCGRVTHELTLRSDRNAMLEVVIEQATCPDCTRIIAAVRAHEEYPNNGPESQMWKRVIALI